MAGILPSAVSVIGDRSELGGPKGTLEPLGVIAGIVFAMVARALYAARLMWFQKSVWWLVSFMLRGMAPRDQEDKSVKRSRLALVGIANKDDFDEQYGHISARPGDKSCV